MCGIGGVLVFPKERTKEELVYIREVVSNLAYYNQARGKDATGVAFFSNRSCRVYKDAVPAEEMIVTRPYRHVLAMNTHANTKNILIHTRMGTKGSEQNPLNNHPIESHRYIGIHNGSIFNDDELFEQHSLYRAGEVDSEIIFRLLDGQGDIPTDEGLKYVAEKLSGNFTTAFVPKKARNKMYIIKNDNPITLIFVPELNAILFASMENYITRAIEDANKATGWEVVLLKEYTLSPLSQSIMKFDTDIDDALAQLFTPPAKFTENERFGWGSRGYGNWHGARFHNYANGWGDWLAEEEEEALSLNSEEDELELEAYLNTLGLSEDHKQYIMQRVAATESSAWTEGWSQGRESLGEEKQDAAARAYDEGYEGGYMDGQEDRVSQLGTPLAMKEIV